MEKGALPGRGFTVDEIMAILPETPRLIAAVTDGLTPTELRASPGPEPGRSTTCLPTCVPATTCSAAASAHRFRGGADVAAPSPRTWIGKTDYPEWEFAPAFTAFKEQRTGLLTVLERCRARAGTGLRW